MEDRDNVSIWSGGHICLQPTIMVQVSLVQDSSPAEQPTAHAGNLASSYHPWKLKIRELTQENADPLATTISVSNAFCL